MSFPKATKLVANYITNLSLGNSSGGWNGMNTAIHKELSQHFELNYVGPINPPAISIQRLWAKLLKTLGRTRQYYFFSDRRLKTIANKVSQLSALNANFDYYHGITPWIACTPSRSSFAYADACFLTYYDTYHKSDRFDPRHLQRIALQEKLWLLKATRVFFSSQYALDECCRRYQISGDNFERVGLGASIEAPDRDTYSDEYNIVFIAVDFNRKGGHICVSTFNKFRHVFNNATLTLIGAEPPAEVLHSPGVSWAGFLSKEIPEQLKQLRQYMASAFALVLPTVSDMTPLVVAEAAMFGCPTLAPRSFGIPEMIEDGVTGRLLPSPPTADEFAEALIELARDLNLYRQMRRQAREFALQQFTWKKVGERITNSIQAE